MSSCSVVILAAGEGTRMKSSTPKVLHKAAGLPMIEWVTRAAVTATGLKPIVVYGSGGDALKDYLGERASFALQSERRGSGHAAMMAKDEIEKSGSEYVIVLAGDMPMIRAESIKMLYESAVEGDYGVLLLTGRPEDPTGYGRIIRGEDGGVLRIVEQADATEEELKVREVNVSVYCFKASALIKAFAELKPNNKKNEYYITDAIGIILGMGLKAGAVELKDMDECEGVNDRVQLARAEKILRRRINEGIMREGVTMIDPDSTYIGADVKVGRDAVIYPGVTLEKETVIGEGAVLYPGSRIENSTIGAGTVVQNSVIIDSSVGENSQVGPYAFLRPGSNIGNNCRIGDFVEVKNSNIGDRSKVSHLTYIGDGDMGTDVNVGCGVVFVNYDGTTKARTKVGDGAFIGCNTNLISPVEVGDNSYIAAGATVTVDVPEGALLIARAREVIKPGLAKGKYRIKKK